MELYYRDSNSYTLGTLLIASTNFSVLVAYWIWLVLFLSEKYHAVSLKSTYNWNYSLPHLKKGKKKDNLSHLKKEKKFGGNFRGSKF